MSPTVFASRYSAITYLDVEGFRFYSPALMTMFIVQGDEHGMLLNHILWNLKVSVHGKIKGADFNTFFNLKHRAAIIRFLKCLMHHNREDLCCDEAPKLLLQIQFRTSLK